MLLPSLVYSFNHFENILENFLLKVLRDLNIRYQRLGEMSLDARKT